jgi:dipeptidyl-peptidase-4
MSSYMSSPRARRVFVAGVIFCAAFGAFANPLWSQQKPDPSRLTLERIFSAREFDSEPVDAVRWLPGGGGYLTFVRAKTATKEPGLFIQNPAAGTVEALAAPRHFIPPGKTAPLAVDGISLSADASRLLLACNSQKIWRRTSRADFWVYDIGSHELQRIGGDVPPSSLMHGQLSPDGSRVCFVRDNNLFVHNLQDQSITQLTKDGSDTCLNGVFDWAYEEEFELNRGFRWSPDSQSIAYWQLDTSGVREFHLVDNTVGPYSKVTTIRYPKVGEKNSAARVGVVSVDGGATVWLKAPGDPRDHYIPQMDWAGNSSDIAFQQLNRLQNRNVLFLADARTGDVRPILTETDRAWVDVVPNLHWFDDGKRFLWQSEKDGWQHLYQVSRSGTVEKLLTPGDYDVIELEAFDEKTRTIYFLASPNRPTERALYRAGLDGQPATRVSPADQNGTHSYQISPDAKVAVHTFSTFDRPPVTQFVSLPDHKVIKVLADNKKLVDKLQTLKRPTTEFFRADIGPVQLDTWCIKPPDMDATKKYPVLVYVYGEPAGSTVRDQWAGTRHLFHLMLAQQGYVVMSIENRGTEVPRGREWRKSIYRQVGILAPDDQAAALRAIMKQRPYLDPDRVAIWGWSGGGSMSLNAIFRHGDLYKTAISIAPVANQRYYDSIYQERYMGLPNDNSKGYRDGSPITHAKKLTGNLLLVHGTGDDNCHYLTTEALIDELIAHNKQFDLMAYPNRSHSISEGANTGPHLYGLLTRYLNRHVPTGPR